MTARTRLPQVSPSARSPVSSRRGADRKRSAVAKLLQRDEYDVGWDRRQRRGQRQYDVRRVHQRHWIVCEREQHHGQHRRQC